jgi:hypothetical protein
MSVISGFVCTERFDSRPLANIFFNAGCMFWKAPTPVLSYADSLAIGEASSCGQKSGGPARLTAGMLEVLNRRVGSEIMFLVTDFLWPDSVEAERCSN